MTAQNINIEELLKELGPETLQALEQLLAEDAPAAGPLREVLKNILDERIPLEERLPKPLLPRKYPPKAPPKAPPRQRRGIKGRQYWKSLILFNW